MTIHDPDVVDAIAQILRRDPQHTLALADGLRREGRCIESTVSGWSMGPGLPQGSRIRIALVPHLRSEPGDVVAYWAGDRIVVHRVIHRGRAGAARHHVMARGDAALVPDPPLEQAHVIGPVTGVWQSGQWTPPAGPLARSMHARAVRAVLTTLSIAGLYLSPRATGRALVALHRAAGAVRGMMTAAAQRRHAHGQHEQP